MTDTQVRFHQAVAFLPTSQILPMAKECDGLGYGGMYVSDHMFNPRQRTSRYTYSKAEDGAPGWEDHTPWPDPMSVISACAGATENLLFTTGIYIAPLRDLMTHRVPPTTGACRRDGVVTTAIGTHVLPPSVVHHSGPPASRATAHPRVGDTEVERERSAAAHPSSPLAGFHLSHRVPPSWLATSTVPSVPMKCVGSIRSTIVGFARPGTTCVLPGSPFVRSSSRTGWLAGGASQRHGDRHSFPATRGVLISHP